MKIATTFGFNLSRKAVQKAINSDSKEQKQISKDDETDTQIPFDKFYFMKHLIDGNWICIILAFSRF